MDMASSDRHMTPTCMDVGVDRENQGQAQVLHQLRIPVAVQEGKDIHTRSTPRARQQVHGGKR